MILYYTQNAGFPQLMEISIKMTITLGAGVIINSIYFIIFSNVPCLYFFQTPSPYQDSHMQKICGNSGRKSAEKMESFKIDPSHFLENMTSYMMPSETIVLFSI